MSESVTVNKSSDRRELNPEANQSSPTSSIFFIKKQSVYNNRSINQLLVGKRKGKEREGRPDKCNGLMLCSAITAEKDDAAQITRIYSQIRQI